MPAPPTPLLPPEPAKTTLLAPTTPPYAPALGVPLAPDTARRLIEAFLSGRSPRTMAAYEDDLRGFMKFVGASSIDEAARLLLARGHGEANGLALAWKASMTAADRKPKLASATVNRRLAALRSLVKSARILGLVPWRLEVENVESRPYRDTAGPGRDGVQSLFDEIGKRDDRKGVRDRAIVRLAWDLAVRRATICDLDLSDVLLKGKESYILIQEKGKSEKTKRSLPNVTVNALEAWLAVRGDAPGALFKNVDPAKKGDRLTGNSVYRIIRRLGEEAGIRARPQGIRHASITEVLDQSDGNRRLAQAHSGHKNAKTLDIYDDNLRNLAGQAARLVAKRIKHKRR